VQLNRKIRNIKIFTLLKRTGQQQNAITRIFMRVFSPKKADDEGGRG
jgi:hypothetical protein